MAPRTTYPQSRTRTIERKSQHLKRCLRVTDGDNNVTHYNGVQALFAYRKRELECCSCTTLYSLLQYTKGSVCIGSLLIERVNVDANAVNILTANKQLKP
jgi:hypothetical protein